MWNGRGRGRGMRSGGAGEEPVAVGGVFDAVGEEAGGDEEGFHAPLGGDEVLRNRRLFLWKFLNTAS